MARFICELEGVRGRTLKLFDNKVIINTEKTAGSFFSGNFTDGVKTIFLCDVVGVQLKKSGLLIGYLQFETASSMMNNRRDNMFAENTFTYENGKNGVTNELVESIYKYITDRIEEIKYGVNIVDEAELHRILGALNPPEEHADGDSLSDSVTKERQKIWDSLDEGDGHFGQCEICGKRNQFLQYVEYEDSLGKHKKNLCFPCFCKRDCKPLKNKKSSKNPYNIY